MTCPKCKRNIPNQCKFCPECGADIRFASILTQSAPPSMPQASKREESRHKNDGVQLWAGGPYWADRNIGAEKPEDYGYYFWWGDTVGYKRKGNSWVASNNSSENFMFKGESAPTYGKLNIATGECGVDIATLRREGWITAKNRLVMECDAAHVHWGEGWRMSTKQELYNLKTKCDWTGTMLNGVNGCLVRGRGAYVSNSIFLPAAGSGFETLIDDVGLRGDYWSSVPYSDPVIPDHVAWMLRFELAEGGKIEDVSTTGQCRFFGHPVRPVLGVSK